MTTELLLFDEAVRILEYDQEVERPESQEAAVTQVCLMGMAQALDGPWKSLAPKREGGEGAEDYVLRAYAEIHRSLSPREKEQLEIDMLDMGMSLTGSVNHWLAVGRRTTAWRIYQSGLYIKSRSGCGQEFRLWVQANSPGLTESQVSRVARSIYALAYLLGHDQYKMLLPQVVDPDTGELVPDPEAVFRPELWRRWWPVLTKVWSNVVNIREAGRLAQVKEETAELKNEQMGELDPDSEEYKETEEAKEQAVEDMGEQQDLAARLRDEIEQLLNMANDEEAGVVEIQEASKSKPRIPPATGEVERDPITDLQKLIFPALTRAQLGQIRGALRTAATIGVRGEEYDREVHVLVGYRCWDGVWSRRVWAKGIWQAWEANSHPKFPGWLQSQLVDTGVGVEYRQYIERKEI